jgi:serine protease Do
MDEKNFLNPLKEIGSPSPMAELPKAPWPEKDNDRAITPEAQKAEPRAWGITSGANRQSASAAASASARNASNDSPPTVLESSRKEPALMNHSSGLKRDLGGSLVFLAASLSMVAAWFVGPKLVERYSYAATIGKINAEYQTASEGLKSDPLRNVSLASQMVARKVRPSVVSVNAIRPQRRSGGLGSGVIMSNDGYILTNAHVVEGASHLIIELHDRRSYQASLIGADTISDLALLKIAAPDLIPAEWGDSDLVDVGAIVWAIGSPYGFQQTVTSGILSGKDRPGEGGNQKQALLQTDAAVNPGNSGGPLVDSQGRVIGINTSIFGETFQGISFAVPSATVNFVYDQLRIKGKVIRGYLGVFPDQVSFYDSQRLNLPDLSGAKLNQVVPNSPAYMAGIRPDDVIRMWNNIEVKEFKTLFRLAETTRPHETVDVTLLRDGKEHQTRVTLGELPDAL